jgi:uncharacterized protein
MKFYNRESEIEKLRAIRNAAQTNAQMTVLTGRRRIGKTQLLLHAAQEDVFLYFFVSKKSETLLCQDFIEEIKNKLETPILGNITSFSVIFQYLMELSKTKHFTLIIDEFQEFFNINTSIYSDMQRIWDLNHQASKMNLLLSGSVYSLMHKIFENYKEPLFGRANNKIKVRPFKTNVIANILRDYNPKYTNEDLLALYAFTGGVAKYVQLLMDNKATTKAKMINYIIAEDSIFLTEGKNILVEEFGKEYNINFSILTSIAKGENTRNKIESVIQKEVGGYLTRLERDYGLIAKSIPMFSKSETKNVRYVIEDNFIQFWFRFIFKYNQMIEIGAYDELRQILERDYNTYSDFVLEKYFKTKAAEIGGFTKIGAYWDRKGEIEIDFIAVNEITKKAKIAEIKRKKNSISIEKLRTKANNMLNSTKALKDYTIEYEELSLEDL